TCGLFSFGNVDVASNWFNVVASIGEAVKPIVPPLLKRVFCAKRKVTRHTCAVENFSPLLYHDGNFYRIRSG
ncbi:MAG: hypothetical protein IJ774_01115, partial [Selenomonadaceae bacterium]|nr:hypothetical protein [Selenomonadaceae bacterium]